jgi:hypothetical protein
VTDSSGFLSKPLLSFGPTPKSTVHPINTSCNTIADSPPVKIPRTDLIDFRTISRGFRLGSPYDAPEAADVLNVVSATLKRRTKLSKFWSCVWKSFEKD